MERSRRQGEAAGTKRFDHPGVGAMELAFETLHPAGAPAQKLVIYRADPGTKSHEALALLALEARTAAEPAAAEVEHLPEG